MFDPPLSSSDLERIAKALREWERLLVNGDGGFKPRADLVTRIEVCRPDDDDWVIGHFVLTDGWVGFQPLKAEE